MENIKIQAHSLNNKNNTSSAKKVLLYDMVMPDPASVSASMFAGQMLINFIWNGLVFAIWLFIIKKIIHAETQCISRSKFFKFVFITTIAGALIDMVWGWTLGLQYLTGYLLPNNYHVSAIIIPIIALSAWNYIFALSYLNLSKKQGIFIGIFLGIFTAPWSIFIKLI